MIRTKEGWSELLSGRNYGSEINGSEEEQAKADGIVIVFGYSDDGCEFRGAMHDEVGAGDYREIRFSKAGKFYPHDMEDHEEFLEEHGFLSEFNARFTNMIATVFSPADIEASWIYRTDIPHATFDIMEDGLLYCRGIVFHIDDLK